MTTLSYYPACDMSAELAATVLPLALTFPADDLTGKFVFHGSAPDEPLAEATDRLRTWVRMHLASALADSPDDDYFPKALRIVDEQITVEWAVEDTWITDYDCDGAETYRLTACHATVYVDGISGLALTAAILHAPAHWPLPDWITGF